MYQLHITCVILFLYQLQWSSEINIIYTDLTLANKQIISVWLVIKSLSYWSPTKLSVNVSGLTFGGNYALLIIYLNFFEMFNIISNLFSTFKSIHSGFG